MKGTNGVRRTLLQRLVTLAESKGDAKDRTRPDLIYHVRGEQTVLRSPCNSQSIKK